MKLLIRRLAFFFLLMLLITPFSFARGNNDDIETEEIVESEDISVGDSEEPGEAPSDISDLPEDASSDEDVVSDDDASSNENAFSGEDGEDVDSDSIDPQNADKKFKFSLGLGLGVDIFDDTPHQKIGLYPEFAIGKFGIGLDLSFHIFFENDNIKFREQDWVPDDPTFSNVLSLYLSKFRYIRYGQKGEPIYVRFGAINNGTIGNGFFMGGYTNTLFLPKTLLLGLIFDLDGNLFNFPFIGFETLASDVAGLVTKGDLFGTRFYVRPLAKIDNPVFKNLQIGISSVADFDPYRYADSETISDSELAGINTDDAKVWTLGMDFRLPLLSKDMFTLITYGDIGTIRWESLGGMTGFGGRIAKIVIYDFNIKIIGENFIPVYFDSSYDLSRVDKYLLLETNIPNYLAWQFTIGTSFLQDKVLIKFVLDGPFGEVDDNTSNYQNYVHLYGIAAIYPGLVPGFSFDASYDKKFIDQFRDIVESKGVIIKTRINAQISKAIISFFYRLQYEENNWNNPTTSSGIETTIQFF